MKMSKIVFTSCAVKRVFQSKSIILFENICLFSIVMFLKTILCSLLLVYGSGMFRNIGRYSETGKCTIPVVKVSLKFV